MDNIIELKRKEIFAVSGGNGNESSYIEKKYLSYLAYASLAAVLLFAGCVFFSRNNKNLYVMPIAISDGVPVGIGSPSISWGCFRKNPKE